MMPFLHYARDMAVRCQAGTVVYKEHQKDEWLGRDVNHSRNARLRLTGAALSRK
jgi:hypothetical protein